MLDYLFSRDPGVINYLAFLLTSMAIYALMGLGLNLQWGFTGLINFGVVGFVAIGAYTTALLSLANVPVGLAMVAGGALAGLLALFMGFSTLRLREDYLAIVTIGTAELVRLVANNEEWLTRGTLGLQGVPIPLADFRPTMATKWGMVGIVTVILGLGLLKLWRWMRRRLDASIGAQKIMLWASLVAIVLLGLRAYMVVATSLLDYSAAAAENGLLFLSIVAVAIAFVGLEKLVASPWGRVLKAIREDEEVAKALGKNVFAYKLQSLMLGAFLTGIAGAFLIWQRSNVYPDDFKSDLTFNVWILMILGGAGSNPGVLLGSVIFWSYLATTRFLEDPAFLAISHLGAPQVGAFRVMLIGLVMMGLMVWRPQGVLGNKDELTLGK